MSYNDFTPDYSFNDVEKGRPFRVWCQKVLPTIYDDSLSYYELLNKVVYILNECIDKINELDENVDELNKAYQQLVAYLNEYKNYVETRLDKQDENIAQLEKELDKAIEGLNKRMDNVVEEAGDKIQEIIDSMDIEQIINEKFEQFIDSPEYNTMIENKITQVIGESADLTEMENNVKSIKTTIGASDDEAGGLTTGSVMGKLNYLIKYGTGGGGGGTSTATEALLNDVVNNIGKTSDEGATSATGTIFGKLNLLVKNLVESNFISDFTSRLTNIKTVVDKNNTGINTLQGRCANINTTVSEVHEMVNQQVIPNEQSLMQDVGSIDDKIGTASDSGSNTLFGAINSISSSGGGTTGTGLILDAAQISSIESGCLLSASASYTTSGRGVLFINGYSCSSSGYGLTIEADGNPITYRIVDSGYTTTELGNMLAIKYNQSVNIAFANNTGFSRIYYTTVILK